MTDDLSPAALRVAHVPGVTLGRWVDTWRQRYPTRAISVGLVEEEAAVAALRDGVVDVAFVRLPVERGGLGVIRLYSEIAVLVVPVDSELADLESVTVAAADELYGKRMHALPDRGDRTVADAVELVAAGVGAVILPHSLARQHARKDVVAVPLEGADPTDIAVAWLPDDDDERAALLEDFIGVVRGRTAASSRATPTPPTIRPPRPPAPKRPARAKRPQRRPRQGR